MDNKLNDYKEFIHTKINCIECLKDILNAVSNLKGNILDIDLDKFKEKILKESKQVLTNLESLELNKHMEELNDKLLKFKNEMIEALKSKELEWIYIYQSIERTKNENNNIINKWPLFIMLLGAIICLSCSAVFHLFSAHSIELNDFHSRLDYAGISMLMLGSVFPFFYYNFYCNTCNNNNR